VDEKDDYTLNRERFEENYAGFVGCFPALEEAFNIAFSMDIPKRYGQEHQIVVLCKYCRDRFYDICVMCSQNRGDGTSPLLRSLFEGLVNASYIQKNPKTAEDSMRHMLISMQRAQEVVEKHNGKMLSGEEKKPLDEAMKYFAGPDGKVPGKRTDWTADNIVQRAEDVKLSHFLAPAYYRPIEIAHPSMMYVASQFKIQDGEGFLFRGAEESNSQRVKESLIMSHTLLIEVLVLLHQTFGNQVLKPLIVRCEKERLAAWSNIARDQ